MIMYSPTVSNDPFLTCDDSVPRVRDSHYYHRDPSLVCVWEGGFRYSTRIEEDRKRQHDWRRR